MIAQDPLGNPSPNESFRLSIGRWDLTVYWSEGGLGGEPGWQWGLGYGPALCGSDAQGEGPWVVAQDATDALQRALARLSDGLTELAKP